MFHLPTPVDFGVRWYAYSNCPHNAISALAGRVGLKTPRPTPAGLNLIKMELDNISKSLIHSGCSRMQLDAVVKLYGGSKKAKYSRALREYNSGKRPKGCLTAFVKEELKEFKPNKPTPAARMIQFRDPIYNLLLQSFIKPLDVAFCRSICKGFPKTRVTAKGLNNPARAKLLSLKASLFVGSCYYHPMDAARFDAHVHELVLKLEHGVYIKAFSNNRELRDLLRHQIRNVGKYKNGESVIRYEMKGRRASGDVNTSTGNGIIMCAMLNAFGKWLGGYYDFLADGDDSIFMYTRPLSQEEIGLFFIELGFVMESEPPTTDISQVDFCQSRLVKNIGIDGVMVRNPLAVMTKPLISRLYSTRTLRPKLVKTIGQAELSLNCGVPMLQAFSEMMIRSGDAYMSKRGKKDGGLLPNVYGYRYEMQLIKGWQHVKSKPVTGQARQSFYAAFGISSADQINMENLFSRTTLPLQEEASWTDAIESLVWAFDASVRERLH